MYIKLLEINIFKMDVERSSVDYLIPIQGAKMLKEQALKVWNRYDNYNMH